MAWIQRIGLSVTGLILAFLAASAQAAPLLLQDGRLEVRARWQNPDGSSGLGVPVPLTRDSGTFWFYGPDNVELVVKTVDACSSFGSLWIFAAGLTNVAVHLDVTDTWSGRSRVYDNPAGHAFRPIQDTDFDVCGATHGCGQGTAEQLQSTPRPDEEAEELALLLGGDLIASDSDYARVRADLATIHTARPVLSDFHFLPNHSPHGLVFTADTNTWLQMKAGQYHAWDCVNAWYGVRTEIFSQFPVGVLDLRGVVDLKRVMADFRSLPGLKSLELDAGGILIDPPPPVRVVCAIARGDVYHYFFDDTGRSVPQSQWISQPGAAPVEQAAVDQPLLKLCEGAYLGLASN